MMVKLTRGRFMGHYCSCRLAFDRITYVSPISISGKERIISFWKKRLDVIEASDFEFFRLLLNHLTMQGVHQRGRVEQERPVRQIDVALTNGGQVVLGK
jgi:hypothetical protein